jgi:hypothetical protein
MDSWNFVRPVNAMWMSVCVWFQVCSQSHGYLIAFTGWLSWWSDDLFFIRINSRNPFQEELDYMLNLWSYSGRPHEHCFWAVWLGNVCGGRVLLGACWWFGRLIGHRIVGELSSADLDACNLVTLNWCSTEMDSWNFVGPVNAMGMSVNVLFLIS